MIASPDTSAPATAHDHEHTQAETHASRMQAWAHGLVLQILETKFPLTELARVNQIPFETLREYVNRPEVRVEIDAYEELVRLRARLVGETARPVSIRKMLEVLETPTPRPIGRNPESDQRALYRHADLIRRTSTSIARESRALVTVPGGTALQSGAKNTKPTPAPGGTTPGGTALQSSAKNKVTTSASDNTSLQSSAKQSETTSPKSNTNHPNNTTLESDGNHSDQTLPHTTPGRTAQPSSADHSDITSLQTKTHHSGTTSQKNDSRASSLLTAAGSTRARDHPAP